MTRAGERQFSTNPDAKRVYDELYEIYRELHDAFGGVPEAHTDLATTMKRLMSIRERATAD
jgi:L-ribulokinase